MPRQELPNKCIIIIIILKTYENMKKCFKVQNFSTLENGDLFSILLKERLVITLSKFIPEDNQYLNV